jgi:hypothetical protein
MEVSFRHSMLSYMYLRVSFPVGTVQHAWHAHCREAEQYRVEEETAAVVLQACWRGCLQRKEIERLG